MWQESTHIPADEEAAGSQVAQFTLRQLRRPHADRRAIAVFFLGLFFFPGQDNWLLRLAAFIVAACFLGFVLRAIIKGYDDLGIGSAFRSTQLGVGFEESLGLASSSLDFLGIGGHKLTEKMEAFEAMMRRCAVGGKTVRLLLSHPDNPLLQTLAVRNDKVPNRYSRNVKDSLKRIARLKTDASLNIEVRFYPHQKHRDFQIFRLMFIDNSVCLWSWTVWDQSMGRDNPQVILLNRAEGGPERSAYHAFQDYFNRLWEDDSVIVADLENYRDID
jgi:hypothetical protein